MDVSNKHELQNGHVIFTKSHLVRAQHPRYPSGRCAVEHLSNEIADEAGQAADTLILVSGNLTVTASTNPSPLPSIQLHNSTSVFLVPCKSSHEASYSITALALDQSPPISGHLNVAAFLSTGEFLVLSIDHAHPSATTNKLTHLPSRRDDRSLVTHAAYHQSLLVSLSENFTLSIYDLSSGSVRHSQTLSTFSSYPPTSIVLSSTTRELYKLVLAYSVPVYPSHWSVGATELLIGTPHSPETLSSNTSAWISPKAPGRVVSTRTVRAFQVAEGWIDQGKLRLMREQWSRRVLRVADIQTDGRYVVLAAGDSSPFTTGSSTPFTNAPSLHSPTNIQLYRLSLPMVSPSVAAPRPKLNFVRNLEGQNGPVSSIALADGRCVSYGVNGSIFVWDLDQGTGAEVAAPRSPPTPESYSTAVFDRRSVTFDERRIITASGTGSVVVRRFDI